MTGKTFQLGVYLPEIRATDGFQVRVRIIHAADQFDPEIPAVSQDLTFQSAHARGLWTLTLDLEEDRRHESARRRPPPCASAGSDTGTARRPRSVIFPACPRSSDPFATENGPGLLSVFTVGEVALFVWSDEEYETPPLDELIIYELNVAQFYGTFAGVASRLDYLVGLGVNCSPFTGKL